jgi:hypothetical protein
MRKFKGMSIAEISAYFIGLSKQLLELLKKLIGILMRLISKLMQMVVSQKKSLTDK